MEMKKILISILLLTLIAPVMAVDIESETIFDVVTGGDDITISHNNQSWTFDCSLNSSQYFKPKVKHSLEMSDCSPYFSNMSMGCNNLPGNISDIEAAFNSMSDDLKAQFIDPKGELDTCITSKEVCETEKTGWQAQEEAYVTQIDSCKSLNTVLMWAFSLSMLILCGIALLLFTKGEIGKPGRRGSLMLDIFKRKPPTIPPQQQYYQQPQQQYQQPEQQYQQQQQQEQQYSE